MLLEEFIGQNLLIQKISQLSLDNMPKTLLLVGKKGCGKKTLLNLIAQTLNLQVVPTDNSISLDFFQQIYLNTTPVIFTADVDQLTIRQQNMLLKLLEEPPQSAFMVLYTTQLKNLLPTVVSRCVVWTFAAYSTEDLKKYAQEHNLRYNAAATTPGELLYLQDVSLDKIKDLATLILERIGNASFANTLSLPDRLAFKGETSKIDVTLFNKIFAEVAASRNLTEYKIILRYIARCNQSVTTDYSRLFERCLTELWLSSREVN